MTPSFGSHVEGNWADACGELGFLSCSFVHCDHAIRGAWFLETLKLAEAHCAGSLQSSAEARLPDISRSPQGSLQKSDIAFP